MSYEQALRHSRNHRKDRFYQQCSGYAGDGVPSRSRISEEKTDEYSRKSMTKILSESQEYPVYLRQTSLGEWMLVPKNDLFGHKIDSFEELRQFAADYADVM